MLVREYPTQTVVAESVGLLSDRLQELLGHLATVLTPNVRKLERPFLSHLCREGHDPAQRRALLAVSLIEVVRLLSAGKSLASFFEGVEYSGRRLAKMNLPPAAVVRSLGDFNEILEVQLRKLCPDDVADFQWVRDQLLFCTILTLNNAYYQVRADEARGFYELSRVELASNSLRDLLPNVLQVLERTFRASAGSLFLWEDEPGRWVRQAAFGPGCSGGGTQLVVPAASAHRRQLSSARLLKCGKASARLLLDSSWPEHYQTCWSVPLVQAGEAVGVIQLGFSKSYTWLPRETEFLLAAAERCWQAIEKTRLIEDLANRECQLRDMAERMLQVEEAERRRISRELHDEAGQSLLYIRLQLEMLEQSASGVPADWLNRLRQAREALEGTIVEVRRLISALSPAVLEQLGLEAALRQLVSRMRRLQPIRIRLHLSGLSGLPKNTEVILYRLVQECCNNVAKHSSATNVNISLTVADGLVRLAVEDDGVGFNLREAESRKDSFGLNGLRERVRLMGGSCEIASLPRSIEIVGRKPKRSGQHRVVGAGRIAIDKPGTAIRIEAPIRTGRAS